MPWGFLSIYLLYILDGAVGLLYLSLLIPCNGYLALRSFSVLLSFFLNGGKKRPKLVILAEMSIWGHGIGLLIGGSENIHA